MALIGQIAISMTTDARQFNAGLAQARASMRSFQKSAAVDIKGGNALMKSGLADISNGMQAVGILSGNAMKLMAGASVKAGRKVIDSLGPIKGAALASAEALRYTYGGAARAIGGAIGSGLGKVSGPIVAAAKASAASLAYVYGPAIKAIGSGLSSAFSMASRTMMPMAASLGTVALGLGKVAAGAVLAGRGILKLGVLGAIQGFNALAGAVGHMVGVVREAINTLGKFAAVASVVAGAALWRVARGAMALGEQTDAARVIFGEFTDTVVSRSKLMAEAFGISRKSYLQSAQEFGTIFQGAGYAEKDSATLANHMLELAANTSSLKHIDIQVVLEKMASGLQGNLKPMRGLGVAMEEANVAAYAAKNGIAQLGTEMTSSQKTQARLGLMTQGLAKANNNLALTYESPANQVRSLQGRIENLSDTVGTAINTILGPAIGELTVGVQALQMAWDGSALAAASASVGVVGGAQGQTQAIGMVQQSIGFIADAWQAVGLSFAFVQTKITEGLVYLIENLQGFVGTVTNIFGVVGDVMVSAFDFTGTAAAENRKAYAEMTATVGGFTKTWLEDLKRMQEAQEKTFQMKLAAPAASEGINAAFAAARAQIKAAQEEVKKTTPSIAGLKPKAEDIGKHKEVKFASAMSRGSSEAASTILRSRYSGGKTNDEMKKVSNNTAKANEHLSKIASAVGATGMGLALMENF